MYSLSECIPLLWNVRSGWKEVIVQVPVVGAQHRITKDQWKPDEFKLGTLDRYVFGPLQGTLPTQQSHIAVICPINGFVSLVTGSSHVGGKTMEAHTLIDITDPSQRLVIRLNVDTRCTKCWSNTYSPCKPFSHKQLESLYYGKNVSAGQCLLSVPRENTCVDMLITTRNSLWKVDHTRHSTTGDHMSVALRSKVHMGARLCMGDDRDLMYL